MRRETVVLRQKLAGASLPVLVLAIAAFAPPVLAQTANAPADSGATVDEIFVTAQKKSRAERLQDVPLSVTALGPEQIENLHATSLADIGASIPNVALGGGGTFKGVAAFSIRGLANTGTIPSNEPAVGNFIDGVYLGTTYGAILDNMFDIEGVEVLRGPQGTLQGRNVTGGAVMIRTRRPTDQLHVDGLASVETGLKKTVALSVGGPILGDRIKAKLAGYYSRDDGYFKNAFYNGAKTGATESYFVRPAVVVDLNEDITQTFILEYGRMRGHAVVVQNAFDPALRRYGTNYNTTGYALNEWFSATSETEIGVSFGDGVITNILNYRSVLSDGITDIDGSAQTLSNSGAYLDQYQYSDELRYAGTFGKLDLTVGLLAFQQKYLYLQRSISPTTDRVSGGYVTNPSIGVFAQGEYHFSTTLSATVGLRYSVDHKDVEIHRNPSGNGQSNCVWATKTCPFTFLQVFRDEHSWDRLTPKIGLNWKVTPDSLLYASWSQGLRSGGYNVRSSSTAIPPGPYNEEIATSYEVGYKADLLDNRLRLGLSAYLNDMKGLQRTANLLPAPGSGETQAVSVTRNAADARFTGFEAEATFVPVRDLQLTGSVGYSHAKYTEVLVDFTGDDIVDDRDFRLVPARLAPWSYSLGATYSRPVSDSATVRGNVTYVYRDPAFADERNLFPNAPAKQLTATLTLDLPERNLAFSLYGRNLLNHAEETTQVQTVTGATPRLLRFPEKGRVIGVEARFRM